jgi:DNA-binding transcriptional ArsR family regulator
VAKKKEEIINQRFIRALAHPLRAEILDRLGGETASPKALAATLHRPLSNVAYHVRILRDCGCLDLLREEMKRGSLEHFYRAKPEAFIGGRQWRQAPRSVRAGGVSAVVIQDLSKKAIAALEAGTIDARDESVLSCAPVVVDKAGWKDLVKLGNNFVDDVLEVHKASAKRLREVTSIKVV